LVYLDECEVHRHPRLAKVWRRRGRPLKVSAAGEDRRFVVFGALDYASGRLLWQVHPNKDGAAFVAFLDHLAASFPDGQVVVVLDNVGYHKGHAARRWWVDHHARIRPLWLPAYSPELNLIERVWRHLKDKLNCHRWWADLHALQHATELLLGRLRARFHRPEEGIALVQNFCEVA
jgi:transposase